MIPFPNSFSIAKALNIRKKGVNISLCLKVVPIFPEENTIIEPIKKIYKMRHKEIFILTLMQRYIPIKEKTNKPYQKIICGSETNSLRLLIAQGKGTKIK